MAMTPSCSPFSSITRISRARIRSLVRMKDLAERLSIGGIGRLHSGPSDSPCVVFGLGAPYVKGCAATKIITLYSRSSPDGQRPLRRRARAPHNSVLLDWLGRSRTPDIAGVGARADERKSNEPSHPPGGRLSSRTLDDESDPGGQRVRIGHRLVRAR